MQACKGGCHCGRVSFEAKIPEKVTVHQCNCSICKKTGYLHLIVPTDQFILLSKQENLTEYRFHSGIARHLFCSHCGIKSFYVPRSHPNAYSVNLNCIDVLENIEVTIEEFDGSSWSKNRATFVE